MVPYGVPWGRQKRQWQPCFYKPQGQSPQGHTSELPWYSPGISTSFGSWGKKIKNTWGQFRLWGDPISKQARKQANKLKRKRRKKESTSLNSKVCGECIFIDERAAPSILELQLSLRSLALAVWATHQHLRHWKVVYKSQQMIWDETAWNSLNKTLYELNEEPSNTEHLIFLSTHYLVWPIAVNLGAPTEGFVGGFLRNMQVLWHGISPMNSWQLWLHTQMGHLMVAGWGEVNFLQQCGHS